MTRSILRSLNYYLDCLERAGYPIEECKVFFYDINFEVYIWSDWMSGLEPDIAQEAFDYFFASASEQTYDLCRGVWVKNKEGGYCVKGH